MSKVITWIPRILAIVLILGSLLGVIIRGFGNYFGLAMLVWIALILCTAIAWKSDPFGGAFFVIMGAIYLVVTMGLGLETFFLAGPMILFITGSLFIVAHIYGKEEDSL